MWAKELKSGQTVVLTDRQHAQLLERFDLSNVVEGTTIYARRCIIDVPCLCSGYDQCSDCPLDTSNIRPHVGCLAVIHRDVGIRHIVPDLSSSLIAWDKSRGRTARRQIQRIYDFLASFTKVTRKPE